MAGTDRARERAPSTSWRVEGSRKPEGPRLRPSRSKAFWVVLAVALGLNWFVYSTTTREQPPPDVSYTFFREQVAGGNVEEITADGRSIEGVFVQPVQIAAQAEPEREFRTRVPDFASDDLLQLLLEHDVMVTAQAPSGPSLLFTLAFGFGPTILLVGLLVFLMRRVTPGGGLGALTRSRARRYVESDPRTTFADVAGVDEAKAELVEIVDFLRDPDRYGRLGGAIPKGVLLYGPPGTGKTLLARSVAGEAGVPFFSLSASEFVEVVVGVGAGRVRDLFKTAREEAPAIIFIDELDAIGKQRSGGTLIGGQDEREQTLNQILSEMDGFSPSEGVVVIAATNRPETLDSALLRPGRFDRRIAVSPPDIRGRRAILAVHTRAVPLAPDVDLEKIAADTPGMVGADLRNLVNEAALAAARRGRDQVAADDFGIAFERIVLGAERRLVLSAEERERTAYHEAGHALAGMLEAGGDPVRKISIVPRGQALGITFQRPEADRYGYSAAYLFGRLVFAMGGRAAEELVYGVVTTGPEGDIETVTSLARRMIGRWGMSEAVGPVAVVPRDGETALVAGPEAPSEATRELVDLEVRRLVERAYERALEHLRLHRKVLDRLAAALLDRETLDEDEIYELAGIPRSLAAPVVEAT